MFLIISCLISTTLQLLSTAIVEYPCPSVCGYLCVCLHNNSKNNDSVYLKLEHIVVFENSLDEFDTGIVRSRLSMSINQIKTYKLY